MKWLLNLSAFNRVILGLGLGIFAGLFFGELAGNLEIFGQAYIRLLQMTVIPYIIVSGLLILLIWGITEASNLFLALTYPDWTTASLFSTSLLEGAKPFDPLTLYIPSNPFYSMANAVVPAVVVFSIMLGVALISVRDKDTLLTSMGTLSDALMKIASFVGRLAPFGIFAISAAAAGTLKIEELSRLQVYLWAYLGAWTVITFWTLPAIVAWSTPLSYRQVLRESRVPMITAFATGTVLVVLPMIAERCKRLLAENDLECPETDSVIDVMVPTAYSFPSAGTLLGLGFIMFSAWYVGSPISIADYVSYVGVGAFVAFGSMAVAIPFMLDFFSLPADMFQLYLLGSVATARFATALAAMHGIVISLLVAFAVMGKLRVRTLLQIVAVSIAIAGTVSFSLGFILKHVIHFEYSGEEDLVAKTLITEPVTVRQVENLVALSAIDPSIGRIEAIIERGTLRVAYMPDRLPFAYRNSEGIAVGYDIDLVQRLAEGLGVKLELARLGGLMWPWVVSPSHRHGPGRLPSRAPISIILSALYCLITCVIILPNWKPSRGFPTWRSWFPRTDTTWTLPTTIFPTQNSSRSTHPGHFSRVNTGMQSCLPRQSPLRPGHCFTPITGLPSRAVCLSRHRLRLHCRRVTRTT
jgi:Na+/H+-dicarboxylate symporter